MHGRADRMIACAQSERLCEELRGTGAEVDLHVYDGADHMWQGAPERARDALDRTIAFLRERLHA
nr:prolyl oligopeptidase family serine peptidase [Microbispora sp. NBRC 16548]